LRSTALEDTTQGNEEYFSGGILTEEAKVDSRQLTVKRRSFQTEEVSDELGAEKLGNAGEQFCVSHVYSNGLTLQF
jgi:hypothetical protein